MKQKKERKILKGMALKSKGDYNKNEYGIITVKTWIEDLQKFLLNLIKK